MTPLTVTKRITVTKRAPITTPITRTVRFMAPFMLSALLTTTAAAQSEVEWLQYDSADIETIDEGTAFGMGPALVLESDELKGAKVVDGNPTIIQYQDGSTLILKRYTQDLVEQEYGYSLDSADSEDDTLNVADVPAVMLYTDMEPEQVDYDNTALVRELQETGERLLRPLGEDTERFYAQRNTQRLWFILGARENLAFITNSQLPDQYIMVRSQNMPRSDFLSKVVKGALQPQGTEWESEERDIPKQPMIPLPK